MLEKPGFIAFFPNYRKLLVASVFFFSFLAGANDLEEETGGEKWLIKVKRRCGLLRVGSGRGRVNALIS